MTRLPLSLALATAFAATATVADAKPIPPERALQATYNEANQRYCVRATTYDHTDLANVPIYRRTCLTERQWNARGVRFERQAREG